MRDGSSDDPAYSARPSSGWGKLLMGLLLGGAIGAGAFPYLACESLHTHRKAIRCGFKVLPSSLELRVALREALPIVVDDQVRDVDVV